MGDLGSQNTPSKPCPVGAKNLGDVRFPRLMPGVIDILPLSGQCPYTKLPQIIDAPPIDSPSTSLVFPSEFSNGWDRIVRAFFSYLSQCSLSLVQQVCHRHGHVRQDRPRLAPTIASQNVLVFGILDLFRNLVHVFSALSIAQTSLVRRR